MGKSFIALRAVLFLRFQRLTSRERQPGHDRAALGPPGAQRHEADGDAGRGARRRVGAGPRDRERERRREGPAV